jgi:hypothetical protein
VIPAPPFDAPDDELAYWAETILFRRIVSPTAREMEEAELAFLAADRLKPLEKKALTDALDGSGEAAGRRRAVADCLRDNPSKPMLHYLSLMIEHGAFTNSASASWERARAYSDMVRLETLRRDVRDLLIGTYSPQDPKLDAVLKRASSITAIIAGRRAQHVSKVRARARDSIGPLIRLRLQLEDEPTE